MFMHILDLIITIITSTSFQLFILPYHANVTQAMLIVCSINVV